MKDAFRKSLVRAQQAPGNVVAAVGAAVAFALVGNPLPIAVWVIGSGMWTAHALTSRRYTATIAEEERAALIAKTAQERTALRQRVERVCAALPFRAWIRSRDMPDYLRQFDGLLDLQRRIAQVLRSRGSDEFSSADRVLRQLDSSLTAYLRFVWARIAYLQQLTGRRVATAVLEEPVMAMAPQAKAPGPVTNVIRWWFGGDTSRTDDTIPSRDFTTDQRRHDDRDDDGGFDCTASQQRVAEKIAALQQRIAKAPEAARATLAGNVKLLEKLQKVLEDVAAADAKVTAQLAALHDAFELILSQVSATQFDAGGIVEYMDSLASEVEETERFVAAMQPTDETLGMDLPMLGASA